MTLAVVTSPSTRLSILPAGIAVPVADNASIVMVWGLGLGGARRVDFGFF